MLRLRIVRLINVSSILVVSALVGLTLRAEMDDVSLQFLSEDPGAVSLGKEIYQTVCFSCHGHRLEGGTGFYLRDGEWIHGGAPSSILKSIAKGFPEKGMVAYETVYDESTLANVVAYILSERVGFQDLHYQVYNAPAEPSSLETLVQGALTGEGGLSNGYADTSIPGDETFAMVFKGGLIAPKFGEVHLLVSQLFEHEISVF